MKIGIWIDRPMDKQLGGGYTYINTLVSGICNYHFDQNIEIIYITLDRLSDFEKPYISLRKRQRVFSLFISSVREMLKLISQNKFENHINFLNRVETKFKFDRASSFLTREDVKIIFYPRPSSYAIKGIPFILNNWDLAHHATYPFPEIVDYGGFHKRNGWYKNIMVEALMVLCESQAGKKELVNYLNFNPDKIKILPIFSSGRLINRSVSLNEQAAILEKLNLRPQQFFFYPAQFWAHKNHYHLITAFQKFVEQHPGFKLLLCGSDKGNLAYIKSYVKTLSLEANVIFSGFIEDDVLYTLYKNGKALIMPTIFGPTSIPPIEAMQIGCPVLCSDMEGHRETMQYGALYFNPLDHLSILESMNSIMKDSIRMQMLQHQSDLSKTTPHTIEQAMIKLEAYFLEAINIRSCWE